MWVQAGPMSSSTHIKPCAAELQQFHVGLGAKAQHHTVIVW